MQQPQETKDSTFTTYISWPVLGFTIPFLITTTFVGLPIALLMVFSAGGNPDEGMSTFITFLFTGIIAGLVGAVIGFLCVAVRLAGDRMEKTSDD